MCCAWCECATLGRVDSEEVMMVLRPYKNGSPLIGVGFIARVFVVMKPEKGREVPAFFEGEMRFALEKNKERMGVQEAR